jgi:hypothetical protein
MSSLDANGSSSPPSSLDISVVKTEQTAQEYLPKDLLVGPNEKGMDLHRGLKARHITMVRFSLPQVVL